jgi:hypothetical protein
MGPQRAQWDHDVGDISCHRALTCGSCSSDMMCTPPSRRAVADAAPPVLFRARGAERIGWAGKAISDPSMGLSSNWNAHFARFAHTYTHFDMHCFPARQQVPHSSQNYKSLP